MAIPAAVVRTLPLLEGLPDETIVHLATLISERSFARRAVVVQKNDPGQALCFLVEGRLQATDFTLDGREVGLFFIEPGQPFGELAIVDQGTQSEFVIAVARSRVAFLPAAPARALVLGHPAVAEKVLRRLAGRLRAVTDQRTLLALHNPLQRVCAQLVMLSEAQSPARVLIRHVPTHQEIAIMVNTSRETVTRAFQLLATRGVVERAGPDLRLIEPAYLEGVMLGKIEPPRIS